MAKEIFQLEAVYGVFAPHRLHMRLNGSLFDYAVDDALPQSMSTIVHEHMHLFQTLFTGYGHIAWDGHRQLTSYVVSEWVKEHSNLGKKRFLPLAHFANENPSRLAWALILDSTIKESIIIGMARHWHSDPGATLKKMGLKITPHEWIANPTIKVNGEVHVLQTKELIEGHAQFVENTFLENAYNYSKEVLWNHNEIPKTYWVALDWFIETCGEDRYFEFPFICDLALQTSWNPVIPTTEEEWRASNPSWRFVHLSKTLSEIKDLSLGSIKEIKEKYTCFVDTLLKACGYKSLNEILSERLNGFNRKDKLLPLEEFMKSGITFRQKSLWCGGNPAIDLEFLKNLFDSFQAPMIEIEGGLGVFGANNNNNNVDVWCELQYQALAAQIFGDFSSEAIENNSIECAFAKYKIQNGCEFQRTHNCTGLYKPSNGPPHPVVQLADGTLTGCYLEMLLNSAGTKSENLEVDHFAKLPIY